jgi:hypothetical protein
MAMQFMSLKKINSAHSDLFLNMSNNLKIYVAGHRGVVGSAIDCSWQNGSPRKLMNSKLPNKLGWFPGDDFSEGLSLAYENFLKKNCYG